METKLSIKNVEGGLFILGGPGAGKTVAVRHIIAAAENSDYQVVSLNKNTDVKGMLASDKKYIAIADGNLRNQDVIGAVNNLIGAKNVNLVLTAQELTAENKKFYEQAGNKLIMRLNRETAEELNMLSAVNLSSLNGLLNDKLIKIDFVN